jgi:hypothetical protein
MSEPNIVITCPADACKKSGHKSTVALPLLVKPERVAVLQLNQYFSLEAT